MDCFQHSGIDEGKSDWVCLCKDMKTRTPIEFFNIIVRHNEANVAVQFGSVLEHFLFRKGIDLLEQYTFGHI